MIIGCTHALLIGAKETIDFIDPHTDTLRTDVSVLVRRETTREEWLRSNANAPRSTLTANMLDVLDNPRYYDVVMES